MENFESLDRIYQEAVMHLKKVTNVHILAHHYSEVFINLFRQHFLNGSNWLYHENGNISRSNWTYHSASSLMLTCRDMNYKIQFEFSGRHDACVRDRLGSIILYAEWEWVSADIFGNGKELNKLIRSVQKDIYANALLLTYVEDKEYKHFLKRVYDEWTSKTDAQLFLIAPIMQRTEDFNSIVALRVVHIQKGFLICWAD
jgi:hypothetical protein